MSNTHVCWKAEPSASSFVVAVVQMPSNWLSRINKYPAVTQSGSRPTTSVTDSRVMPRRRLDAKSSRRVSQIVLTSAPCCSLPVCFSFSSLWKKSMKTLSAPAHNQSLIIITMFLWLSLKGAISLAKTSQINSKHYKWDSWLQKALL